MLKHLRSQNVKSWQDTGDMAFGRLTGCFGTHPSGKCRILRFLFPDPPTPLILSQRNQKGQSNPAGPFGF
jgi:hypothetical protein